MLTYNESLNEIFFEICTQRTPSNWLLTIRCKVTDRASAFMNFNTVFLKELFLKIIHRLRIQHGACDDPSKKSFLGFIFLRRLIRSGRECCFSIQLSLSTALCPVFSICDSNLCRIQKIHLIEGLLLAHEHGFGFQIFQKILCYMMLMTGKRVAWSLHEILSGYIKCTNTVDDNVHMNIAGRIVSVRMCTDKSLMSREVLLSKFHAKSLGLFRSQSIVITVSWIEADDIVMSFDF